MAGPLKTVRSALRVAGVYALFGIAWILVNDWLAHAGVASSKQHHFIFHIGNALLFVGLSTTILFVLVRRELRGRRQVEAALEDSKQQLGEILDTTNEAILLIAPGGQIRYANAAAERMAGVSRAAISGGSVDSPRWEVTSLDGTALRPDEYTSARAFATERPVRDRWIRARRADGRSLVLATSAAPLRDSEGRITGVVGTARDITERFETEQELRRRDAYLRALIEGVSDIIAVVDTEGRVRFHTPSTQDVLGYSEDEIAGRQVLDLVHPDDQESTRRVLQERDDGLAGLPRTLSLRVQHKDGSWRHLEAVGTRLVEPDSRDVQIIVTARDVTARKEAEAALALSEAQLQHAQRMEAIGRLAGGVAHDFNNLITGILGYTHLLRDALRGKPELLADLDEIVTASERAHALTRQLLVFSRSEVQRPRLVDVGELVRGMDKLLRRVIGEDIRLHTFVGPRAGPVHIDPGQLEQVIMNLAVNARDAMPQGGQLRITVERRESASGHPASSALGAMPIVRLDIQDTGVGMDEETLRRAFEPFFTTKEPGIGTGLGLSIVYGIISDANGHTRIESRPGEGTLVRIDLPVAEPSVDDAEGVTAPHPTLASLKGRGTVLVVEDEPGVRRLCRRLLTRLGYTVLEASSGREAIDIAERSGASIDVVLTDIVMPEIGGRRLVEALRTMWPGVRVILMSGYTDDTVLRHGVERGSFRFLAKPFSPIKLAQAVAEAFGDD